MSIKLDFDLTGLDRFERELESELDRLARNAVVATGKVVKARAKQGPFKDHTRQLRSTINDRNIGLRNGWYLVEVVAPMRYASFVEKGTNEHDIWPMAFQGTMGPLRKGQSYRSTKAGTEVVVGRGIALRWKDGSGNEHFARYVHHPGSRPYPFMKPAAEFGRAYIRQFVQRGFAGIAIRLESHGW